MRFLSGAVGTRPVRQSVMSGLTTLAITVPVDLAGHARWWEFVVIAAVNGIAWGFA